MSELLNGFGNNFESEAIEGSLPRGQNSPKQPLMGLVPEQLSGSAFTVQRHRNLKSWLYRIHPSTLHGPYKSYPASYWLSDAALTSPTSPAQMRWLPLEKPKSSRDFIDGVTTMVTTQSVPFVASHHYQFNLTMGERFFCNADAELIFIPQVGGVVLKTEMGVLKISPQEIAVIPRGVKFQVEPQTQNTWVTGYLGENSGHPLTLPELGPLGANGLAHARDFIYPHAQFEFSEGSFELITKLNHLFWSCELKHSPLDVVAWHGNYAPYKYDLRKFNTMGTVSFDHPDPSIYTVLTSPSASPGVAHLDFVIFPPRWLVAENTFRPPYYHRNVMSEYMGLIHGVYDAKQGGFLPGGASLHNCMTAHGPDTQTFIKGIENSETPQKINDTMAFMFETCHLFRPTQAALESKSFDKTYTDCWQNFKPLFRKS